MGFEWKTYSKKPTSIFGYIEWLYFMYCLTTGLYMLDHWERILFSEYSIFLNGLLFGFISLCCTSSLALRHLSL